MPVQYEGVRQEHVAVRTGAGLFDVSHMGEIETHGPARALAFLRHLLSNDLVEVGPGGAQYALSCREDGGVLDDLFTYWLENERFLTVVNASNADTDFAWFAKQAAGLRGTSRSTTDRPTTRCSPSRGPEAVGHVRVGARRGRDPPAAFTHREATVAGARALVCRTGYTGEDGVELLLAPADADGVWRALTRRGRRRRAASARATPCASRSATRSTATTYRPSARRSRPASDGPARSMTISSAAPSCVSRPRAARTRSSRRSSSPSRESHAADARSLSGEDPVGVVTSGTLSPCMEVGIGMAYVRSDLAAPGTELTVDVRGKRRAARVESKPLYKKE